MTAVARPSEALAATTGLLTRLSRATASRAIYPAEHPTVAGAVDDLVAALGACLEARGADEVTFFVLDEEVVVDDRPVRARTLYLVPFVRLMGRLGVQRLTLARGLDREEAGHLVESLVEGPAASSDHAAVGRVEVTPAGVSRPAQSESLSEEDLDRGAWAFAGLPGRTGPSLEALDRIVWKVASGPAAADRSLLLLAPVETAGERLFLHSIHVATLAVALARSLGVRGGALHDVGLGAMLHDVGKLALPESVWDGKGPAEEAGWQALRRHPELGAALLCRAAAVPPLAVLVAHEHHLRWDGRPSYPATRRAPGLASRITAVADTWDVLASASGDLVAPRPQALEMCRRRAGTVLDPDLVDAFVLSMAGSGEPAG